jgi:hypothetical protein
MNMSKHRNSQPKAELALAVASGQSVAGWAKAREVPEPTAHAVDRAIGRLARRATQAVEEIVTLSKTAKSEAVKLAAARAILSELAGVTSHAAMQHQLAELHQRIASLEGNTGAKRVSKTSG